MSDCKSKRTRARRASDRNKKHRSNRDGPRTGSQKRQRRRSSGLRIVYTAAIVLYKDITDERETGQVHGDGGPVVLFSVS